MGNFGGWGYNEGVRDGDALGWGWGSCPQTRCRAVTPTSRRCCIKPGWKICSGGRASLGQPGLFGLRGGCFGSCCRCVLEERGMSGAGKKKKSRYLFCSRSVTSLLQSCKCCRASAEKYQPKDFGFPAAVDHRQHQDRVSSTSPATE